MSANYNPYDNMLEVLERAAGLLVLISGNISRSSTRKES
jgi:hypothetical protein